MSPGCNDVSGKELQPHRQRRSHIPDKPNYSLNLWSIMKNCIGKELSKIPMPVSELHCSGFLLGQRGCVKAGSARSGTDRLTKHTLNL